MCAPSIRTLAVIAFPHAPQRFSTVRLVFGLASAFKNDAERESVRKRLASKVGVAAKVVEVGCCEEEAGGLQATAVTIGPLPTAQADDVTVQLRACVSDLAETGRLLKVDVQRISEPVLETCRWSFGEAVLHAAVAAVNVTFVGPKSCQTRLERSAMSFFKEDGDLALRPHVLFNWLLFRERRDSEAYTFEGEPLSASYAAVQAMIAAFDARTRILENVCKVYNTAIERCTEASDIANVRVGAQTAAHSAVADDAEAEARPTDELAPHMMHVAVLDRHEQPQEGMLEGLSAMCRSGLPAVASYVDPVNMNMDGADGCTSEADCPACQGQHQAHTCGKMLNRGQRNDLVLQRGDFALDDYGTPRCRVTCYPHAPSPRLTPEAPSCHRAESGAEVLYKSCWHLFHLRRGLTLGQSVTPRQLRRLFTHYENRFAECIPLVQHNANVNHRHATNKAVAIRVDSHPEAFAKFQQVVNDAAFHSKLKRAQEAPKGAEAAEIMKAVVGFINAAVRARLGRCVADSACSLRAPLSSPCGPRVRPPGGQGPVGHARASQRGARAHRGAASARCCRHLLHLRARRRTSAAGRASLDCIPCC